MQAKDILNKMIKQEREAFDGTFLAPVVFGGAVRVTIAGIPYSMFVKHNKFEGWAILKRTKSGFCEVIERAPLPLVDKYLALLPRVRLVLLGEFDGVTQALSASNSDVLSLSGPVPVRLVERAGRFDTVYARFDGAHFWFDKQDRRRDPSVSHNLNRLLRDNVEPDIAQCLGSVPQEKLAYKMLWISQNRDAIRPLNPIAAAVAHGGGVLDRHWKSGANTNVTFLVDGHSHTVSVNPKLGVISSGICLSGRDGDFDLTSLVSVFKEKHNDDYDED